MSDTIEYAIYCRKSTDDSSGMQIQSIPDQINKCIKYASDNKLKIMEKPENFTPFETAAEILKEDNETDIENRRIYQDTRNLFIIKEQKSGKIPGVRPKRSKLIKLIKKGKIKGLLSYAPDRQARNILEGGELINLVDEGLIDLKYTNFHFDNNASGKMMLGIWFVFSKQYSDKLSEDISRGNASKVGKGKALGTHKYGYYRDEEDGYYKPHPQYFELMQEAFKMKIYARKSDEFIANWLNSHGYRREYKKKEREPALVSGKRLGEIWVDEFYYGIFTSGGNITDLRDEGVNPFYKPMILEEEHVILLQRHKKEAAKYTEQRRKEKFDEVTPVINRIVVTKDGYGLTHNIPNRSRFEKRLKQMQKDKPGMTLKDIVQPHQIYYKCSSKKSKYHNLAVTYDVIDKAVLKLLSSIEIDDEKYKEYLRFMGEELEQIVEENKTKASKIQIQINRNKSYRARFVKKNMGLTRDKLEEEIYQKEKSRINGEIDLLEKERQALDTYERNTIFEFETIVNMLRKSHKYFEKASYVQKRHIIEIFASNIVVTAKNRVKIKVNPILEGLFSGVVEMAGVEPASESHNMKCLPL